jgi:hypothetical protein
MTDTKEEWAIVEIMGHVRCAGRIAEVTRFGSQLLQVDIPTDDGFVSRFYGGSAIYAVHPCSEDVARASAAQQMDPRPTMPMNWRPQVALPAAPDDDDPDGFDFGDERID